MDIPLKYKRLWNDWDVRVLILLSLSIQIILIFLGRMRRTYTSRWIRMIVWCSYLLADWVADFALGQLSSTMDDSSSSSAIIAFWAPFLILHLGGPDTITAYSMEDNELWARHLLGLAYELLVAFYVLFRSFPNTHLLVPTLLVFLVAIIKYIERSYSLYKASIKGFSSSIIHFNRKLPKKDVEDLAKSFWLYSTVKPSFVDVMPHIKEQDLVILDMKMDLIRGGFMKKMSTELNFAYDEFYTKAVINHSRTGYVLRVICSICILLTFSLFVSVPKDDFEYLDIVITYVLLVASICLDVVATIMLVFSDRMVVSLLYVNTLSNWCVLLAKCIVRIKSVCQRERWLIKLPQLNILNNCLIIAAPNETPREKIINWVVRKLRSVQEITLYMTWIRTYTLRTMQPVRATTKILRNITFYLESHLELPIEELDKPAGFSALQKLTSIVDWAGPLFVQLFEGLPPDQVVLVWHIATELCFHCIPHQTYLDEKMETSKYISNYMMHTVIFRTDLMPAMGEVSLLAFSDAIDEMVNFIKNQQLMRNTEVKELCRKMISTPIDWIHNRSIFVIAQVLARLMLIIEEKKRWEVMTSTWVELLIKGANSTRGNVHMKQLSMGGELLTFIWLLCKHVYADKIYNFGFARAGDRFRNAELLVSKIEEISSSDIISTIENVSQVI